MIDPIDGAAAHAEVCTVLVADDDDDIREVIADALRDQGLRVVEVESGARALSVARSERVDAIVTDQRMPGLTGAELVCRLRELGIVLPTILITAAGEAREIAAAAGIHCYLGKPFGLSELVAKVRRALAGDC